MRACVRRSGRGLAAVSVLTLRTVARRPQKMSRLPVELAVDDEHVGMGPAAATIRTSRTVPRGHACPRSTPAPDEALAVAVVEVEVAREASTESP